MHRRSRDMTARMTEVFLLKYGRDPQTQALKISTSISILHSTSVLYWLNKYGWVALRYTGHCIVAEKHMLPIFLTQPLIWGYYSTKGKLINIFLLKRPHNVMEALMHAFQASYQSYSFIHNSSNSERVQWQQLKHHHQQLHIRFHTHNHSLYPTYVYTQNGIMGKWFLLFISLYAHCTLCLCLCVCGKQQKIAGNRYVCVCVYACVSYVLLCLYVYIEME